MPIKKDGSGKRWVEMELIVPGTPEQVWQAMATGSGNTAWFTPTTIDERVGGAIHFDMGENGESKGEVTVWEPPLRFGYVERDWGEGAPPLATEITVTARSGDRCIVRMVHSLFALTDDWDDQMEGFESGWPGFFQVLRVYLAHFAGMKAAVAFAITRVEAPQLNVWKQLTEGLSLAGANVGDERTLQTPEKLSGVVEHVQQDTKQRYVLLRLSQPAPGIALIGTYGVGDITNASLAFYLYGDDAEQRAAASEPRWRDWLGKTFKRA
ncbi:SRPBCC domain-containing protein [Hyphomicrobium sp.]|uniref:SRPBCC family protein n=1 Tax=Hyphomicrobium sp. TaxID=82 RepID=UPI0025BAC2C9|nr:SRPBCC domain-containing protein [Hyphomicrobium sp.]MCC7254063.1 SRPBCC domain-containing protein [Hyphomicrobium sp.]